MDKTYMNMHLTVDRYLRDMLTDDEKALFEERLLWDQDLIDEVDLAERLREGLVASVNDAGSITGRPGFRERLYDFFYVPQYAAAASFVLAAILVSAVFLTPTVQDSGQFNAGAMNTEIIPLVSVRSNDAQQIYIDSEDLAVLLVDVIGEYEQYRVTVQREGNDAGPVWQQAGLTATYPESLALSMPGTTLTPGSYTLRLEGGSSESTGTPGYELIQNIRFVVSLAD